ncbi:MAG: phosphoribosylglycinamide formyltransferase [Candidatus Amulumruptor caecigallinarius]|uniref:Phosphoribosylglycinamide formyltransferase n=1 Tax=Candidatus Amulumruptor caecigallinarius TaxID=2109911 RepID=A0A4Q0UAZ8_9BACT|nr:MAG: phosphoribosylglycinamide formyltransferase [Candidatus Amulumruptor caecigallinarius]HJE39066.1 phosphoribosylglycinamide formyltransferase [Candidatus Amulumruptor caecigallinarius]
MRNIAVFASGSGTNAENIAKSFQADDAARVVVALANKADAGVHERMRNLRIPSLTFDNNVWAEHPEVVMDVLEGYHVDFVALAGFLRQVHPMLVGRYKGRMLNIHPSLLPKFGGRGMYGMRVHRAVIEAAEKESGATVHLVTDVMDDGDIVLQGRVDVSEDETPESLAAKVHEVEMDIYPRAVRMMLGRLS